MLTDNEALNALVESVERLEFVVHAQLCGVCFLAAAFMVIGWCYAKRDSDF